WADTAFNWVIIAVVVAVLGAGLVFAFKGFRKSMADIAKKKIWTRRQSWLMVFVGIFPIFFTLLIIWYLSRDYFNFIQIGGLVKGTLFAWLIYLVLMVVGHLVSPWRRELI
ncbi:MAG TPA: hypothetical protein PLL77_16105, partial [Pyrinomonadaceae bacterium]|nr:hypothetical protein [Pyrinomonadaceae bacterium]